MGETVPSHTKRLESMPHDCVENLSVEGEGAVVSLFENGKKTFLAIVNRDCVHECVLSAAFRRKVRCVGKDGSHQTFKEGKITVAPGDIVIFEL